MVSIPGPVVPPPAVTHDRVRGMTERSATVLMGGPDEAVDENIAIFDGTSGRLVKDSGYSIGDISGGHFQETFTATSTKVVNHNLGYFPQCYVKRSSGLVTSVTITHNSVNQLTLSFSGTLTNAVVVCDTAGAGVDFADSAPSVVTKTADYSASIGDDIIKVDASGGAITITLPLASGNPNQLLRIKKSDTTVNVVTIAGNGGETIDGSTSVTLTAAYESLTLISDGTEWSVL